MTSQKLTITNAQGFHMRPAMTFVQTLTKYPCDVIVKTDTKEVDGKSVMNLIAAGLKCGMEIEVICKGEQEEEALKEAVAMIESGFGE